MAITAKPGFAHRFGHVVGAGVGRFLALEPRLARAFRRRGLPPVLVKLLFWSVKLAVIAALLYVAFWAAIFVAGLFLLAAIRNSDILATHSGSDSDEDGWRFGHQGHGYYCGEYRIDSGRFDAD